MADLVSPAWDVILWRDISYLARVRLPHSLVMAFEVFSVAGWLESTPGSGEFDRALLNRKGWQFSGDDTESPEDAEVLLHGYVKWDGCSDWAWNTERVMWHGCSPADVADLTDAVRRTYALAAERLEVWATDD